MSVFSIDGREFDVVVTSLEREFAVTDGENAGRAMSGRMIRDLLGTYYNYSASLSSESLSVAEYDDLYEILSAPEDSHILVMPYGQSTLTFEAYVANGKDKLIAKTQATTLWGNLKINFIAMEPQRT